MRFYLAMVKRISPSMEAEVPDAEMLNVHLNCSMAWMPYTVGEPLPQRVIVLVTVKLVQRAASERVRPLRRILGNIWKEILWGAILILDIVKPSNLVYLFVFNPRRERKKQTMHCSFQFNRPVVLHDICLVQFDMKFIWSTFHRIPNLITLLHTAVAVVMFHRLMSFWNMRFTTPRTSVMTGGTVWWTSFNCFSLYSYPPGQNGHHFGRRHFQMHFLEWKWKRFWFKFHWNLFPGVQLTINQYWFR